MLFWYNNVGDSMDILSIQDLVLYINMEVMPQEWLKYDGLARKFFNKDWLNIDFNEMFLFYDFDNGFKERFLKEIEVLKKDINLNYLVYLWHYIFFLSDNNYVIKWPNKLSNFSDHGSFMMPVVSLLMGFQKHKEVMKLKNFDETLKEYSKNNLKLTCMLDKIRFNIDGIRFSQLNWGSRIMKGNIIQIGCLQYEIKYIYNEKVIYIHIPWNTSLKKIDLDYSFSNARQYVEKYLGVKDVKFVTESWLLSSNLKDILDDNSSILEFQKFFLVVKDIENKKDFLNFVFNVFVDDLDYNELSDDNTLRKGIKEKLLKNEKLFIGYGILKEENLR